MEKPVMDEIAKLETEPNVAGVLVADNKGLCIASKGKIDPNISGHITFMANHISKLDRHDPYPTIVLKSESMSYLIKGSEKSCISVLYQNK